MTACEMSWHLKMSQVFKITKNTVKVIFIPTSLTDVYLVSKYYVFSIKRFSIGEKYITMYQCNEILHSHFKKHNTPTWANKCIYVQKYKYVQHVSTFFKKEEGMHTQTDACTAVCPL